MNSHVLKRRTKLFAHRCVKLASAIPKSRLGSHIAGQLIRSSTSVAANYRASVVAQSRPSFIAKLSIVLEEIDESTFWLEFIRDEKLLSDVQTSDLIKESNELTALFFSARKTLKQSSQKRY